jgi:hypothetical protein
VLKRVLLVIIICCASRVAAQEDPNAFVSFGGGVVQLVGTEYWSLDFNASLCVGYRLWPRGLALAYVDYSGLAYVSDYRGLSYGGYRRAFSGLVGLKASIDIPQHTISPYFMGALGLSNFRSLQDTVYGTSNFGTPVKYPLKKGITPSFLAAFGVDISIYRCVFGFLELRASSGIGNTHIYDLLVVPRAGIGMTI